MARILLIEDDNSFRKVLRLTLAHFGHTVIEASNGNEGLKLFSETHPDLVITDIVMPEKEGLEVLTTLRKIQPPVKVIVMSGGLLGTPADYLRAAAVLGVVKFLKKPFANEVLMEAVNEALSVPQ